MGKKRREQRFPSPAIPPFSLLLILFGFVATLYQPRSRGWHSTIFHLRKGARRRKAPKPSKEYLRWQRDTERVVEPGGAFSADAQYPSSLEDDEEDEEYVRPQREYRDQNWRRENNDWRKVVQRLRQEGHCISGDGTTGISDDPVQGSEVEREFTSLFGKPKLLDNGDADYTDDTDEMIKKFGGLSASDPVGRTEIPVFCDQLLNRVHSRNERINMGEVLDEDHDLDRIINPNITYEKKINHIIGLYRRSVQNNTKSQIDSPLPFDALPWLKDKIDDKLQKRGIVDPDFAEDCLHEMKQPFQFFNLEREHFWAQSQRWMKQRIMDYMQSNNITLREDGNTDSEFEEACRGMRRAFNSSKPWYPVRTSGVRMQRVKKSVTTARRRGHDGELEVAGWTTKPPGDVVQDKSSSDIDMLRLQAAEKALGAKANNLTELARTTSPDPDNETYVPMKNALTREEFLDRLIKLKYEPKTAAENNPLPQFQFDPVTHTDRRQQLEQERARKRRDRERQRRLKKRY